MPTLIITQDGRELQRVPLTQPRTTVGRRPYNDIVMEHLAVSGEHAVFVLQPDGRVKVLDLNSTNGTYVNGRAVVSADVGPGDVVEIARYQLRVEANGAASSPSAGRSAAAEATDRVPPPAPPVAAATSPAGAAPATPPPARLEVVDGPAAGRALTLNKPATTIGKPGVTVAVVERTPQGYRLTQAVGETPALVNGEPLPAGGAVLREGDVIALAGTRIRFLSGG